MATGTYKIVFYGALRGGKAMRILGTAYEKARSVLPTLPGHNNSRKGGGFNDSE